MDNLQWTISSTILVSFAVIAVIYCINWFVQRWRHMNIFKNNGIPSTPTSVLSGNINEFSKDYIKFYDDCFSQYGNVFGYFFGIHPTLIVKDLEVLKHVFVKDFNNFRDRPEQFFVSKMLADSVAIVNGPRWKVLRSVLSPCFSSKKLRLMYNLMNESVSTFLEVIGKDCKDGKSIDIFALCEGLSMDTINKCALAMKRNCQTNPEDEMLVANKELGRLSFPLLSKLVLMFPGIVKANSKLADFLDRSSSFGKLFAKLGTNLRNVIAFRRKNPSHRHMDMLQLMLDASDNKDGGENSSQKSITDDELVANAITFIGAGFGTTSNAMTFTFYLLAKHQDIQDKLRSEINEQLPNGSPDSYEAVHSVDYLDQVFNESLRMYPPVANFVSRQCASTVTINGLTIPKGVDVQAPVYHIHHDSEIWPNPEAFDPSRFSPENKQKIKPLSFLPFGWGPRNCIGNRFAMLEAKLAICRVIQKYRLMVSDKTEDPLLLKSDSGAITPAKGAVYLSAVEI